MGSSTNETPKGTSLGGNTSYDVLIVKIGPLVRARRDHFHQVLRWYNYPSSSYNVAAADLLRDLVTLTFDLGLCSNMAGHVINNSTKFEDPTPIRSWLMSYDVRHRPPLTMRLEPLRMRLITWPVRRGQIFPKYLKSWPRFLYSVCNPHGSTIRINWVICQNSVRPCVKGERDVCACANSRDL